ncbi:MAG: ketoacyl-ACP synthase III [Candidatus Sericytochromatia bacterium]|nr:ketoacyl-ACP synthase III [Candidatus Tanganyikabacteria bacterium]
MSALYRPLRPARLLGTGAHLPGPPLSNADLIARTGLRLTPDWIVRHTGIRTRHWADPAVTTAEIAAAAAREALAASGVAAVDLARIWLATISGDWPTPATACAIQARLGARCPALDLNSACAGFLFAIEHAMRGVDTGLSPTLAIGAELRSRFVNPRDRRTAPIFGDGAGAVVLGPASRPDEGFVAILLETEGAQEQLVLVPAGGSAEPASAESVAAGRHCIVIRDPAELTRRGVDAMVALVDRACGAFGVRPGDVDLLIPHQANGVMLERIVERLSIPPERCLLTVADTGNTVGASLAIALHRAQASPRWRPGALIALATLGGGYSGGVAFYRVPA